MLNIGKLAPGAGEYYLGEVATSAEDYYSGRGETAGRWVGSLATELGLHGEVDPNEFRRVLQGRDPHTGEYLITAQGSAARARQRRHDRPCHQALPAQVDVMRAASHLGIDARYVRRLLSEGESYRRRLAEAGPDEVVVAPKAYLLGDKVDCQNRPGSAQWRIPRDELERFAEARSEAKVRPGYDLTLRPPKSVSVVWALAAPEERKAIRQAHREAVDEVVRYYETHAVRIREGSRARRLVDTAGIVAAAFDHRTSRAGDPLLHTHVVAANMTCTADGSIDEPWRAISGAGLYEHAKAAGHLYQAHLRHLLTERIGVQFGPVVNGYADIDGVPAEVIRAFSKRHNEIAGVLNESGHTSARAAQLATLATRKGKEYGVDPEALTTRWRAEADALGFGPAQLADCLHRTTEPAYTSLDKTALFDQLAGPHGLTERASTFRRTDIIEAIACTTSSALTARQVEHLADEFLGSDHVLLVDRTTAPTTPGAAPPQRRSFTQRTYTTPELARLEDVILTAGQPRTGATSAADDARAVNADPVIADRPELTPEQQAMVRVACTHAQVLLPIAGRPGAGKTYATEAIVAAHTNAGVPILGCAVSASAAAELEAAARFARSTGREATTVARLLLDLHQPGGTLRAGTVIVVDEASMLGTRDLAHLLAAARSADGRLLLVGDPDQHGSVDAGGAFRRLCADQGDQLVRLVANNRQSADEDRRAIDDFRAGDVAQALHRYDQGGQVVRCRTAGECFDAIVGDWYAGHQAGEHDPMIAGPNSTRRALNDRARALLKANGELAGPALEIAGREYQVGDLVVARHNARHLHAASSKDFVKNGSTGTIAQLDLDREEVIVDFDTEGRVRIPPDYLTARHLEHGYARTSYGVQGATHRNARYVPTDASSFEEGYVAVTRGRESTRIYVVDGQTLDHEADTAHAPAELVATGLADVAGSLGRRRANAMVADVATNLTRVGDIQRTHSLDELRRRRHELEGILATAPPDATKAIPDIEAALDAERARHQAAHLGAIGRRFGRRSKPDPSVGRIQRLEHKLGAAQRQQAARELWLDDHPGLETELRDVARAERAEIVHRRLRTIANPEPEVLDRVGPEPALQRDRAAWRRLIEGTHEARLRTSDGSEQIAPEPLAPR